MAADHALNSGTYLTEEALLLLQEVVKGESGNKQAEIPTPQTWQEALAGPHAAEWLESMTRELNGLRANGTFHRVSRKKARNGWGRPLDSDTEELM